MEQKNTQAVRPVWMYKALLLVATLIWGGNFVVAKGAVEAVGGFWVTGIRFLIAGLLLAVLNYPQFKKNLSVDLIKAGAAIGLTSFLGFGSQFWALEGTTPSKNAFLSACYCITVPFIWWLVTHRRPTKTNAATALTCAVGMGFVSLQSGMSGFQWGDAVSILSAFLYGAEIVTIALLLKERDVITVTAVQMLVSGLLGCLVGCAMRGIPDPEVLLSGDFVWRMAYITLLGSLFASTVQNLAQTRVSPSQASLIFAMESVFGTIFSVLFYGEVLTGPMVLGFALILGSILISELRK